jgi:hypothetical protein
MDSEPERKTESAPRPEVIQTNDQFYHVRIRPKEEFTEFRTPLAAEETPEDFVAEGCDVREGRLGPDTWVVQSVLIPLEAADGREEAETLAGRAVDRLES